MHSRDAGATLEGPAIGWRLVDLLISVRRSSVARPLRSVKSLLLLLPALLLVAILATGLVGLVWHSLHRFDTFLAVQGRFSFTQYRQAVSDPQFKTVFMRTIGMSGLTAAIALALALPFSISMARARSRTTRLALMVIIFVPYLTGDITRTFGWLATLGPQGPLMWITGKLGIHLPPLIGTLWAVGLGSVQVLVPAAVVILLPAVLRLDPELDDAASTLGARPFQTFFRVTLPQLRLACLGALTACWAFSMGEFADPAVLGQGIKDYVGNFLQGRYLSVGDPPLGSAVGMILLATVATGAGLILGFGRLRLPRRRV
jgi:ABC-type spermidine/putrescine transport system permease subunit I